MQCDPCSPSPQILSILSAMDTSLAVTNPTAQRALELLSSGIEQEHVASALGVTAGRISQFLADPVFASALAERKFVQLQKHNETDNAYDTLEKKVLDQLTRTLAMVMDPMKLATILTRLNQAKRRGSSAPDSIVRKSPTVQLNIAPSLVARFAVNGANQVVQVSVGEQSQDLVTIQSSNVRKLLNEHAKNVTPTLPSPAGSGEATGVVWRKPQGREKHDLLTECGFAHEISNNVDANQQSADSVNASANSTQ